MVRRIFIIDCPAQPMQRQDLTLLSSSNLTLYLYVFPTPTRILDLNSVAPPRASRTGKISCERTAAVCAPAHLPPRAVIHHVAAVPYEPQWHGPSISLEHARLIQKREPESTAGLERCGVFQLRAQPRHLLAGLELHPLDPHDAGAGPDAAARGARGTLRIRRGEHRLGGRGVTDEKSCSHLPDAGVSARRPRSAHERFEYQ
ncbi:hypothetical protein DFH09DRAFT_130534 [Mycena vulgaris]|nr:hypothetical protein DFH09DRAFT_130534 [Mycena vulgaris]